MKQSNERLVILAKSEREFVCDNEIGSLKLLLQLVVIGEKGTFDAKMIEKERKKKK